MRIGIAGPIDLGLLADLFPTQSEIPKTYSFALIAHLARAFHDRGHEVVLFALSDHVTNTVRIDGERISAYICPRRRPRWEMLDFFRAERYALSDAMRDSGCDVIHAHWTYEFAAAAIQSGLPHVVTAHDIPMVVLRFARHPYWMEKPWMAVPTLRRAQSVTAVSPYVARELERFLRPQKDIQVVPNGVGDEVFALANRHSARNDQQKITFASVLSGWDPRKNAKSLISAFRLLRLKLGDRAELRMVGSGFERGGPAERWAMRQGAGAGIRFVGPTPHREVLKILADDVDVLVHPAVEETFCMAALEAMAIGVPVIGGRHAGAIPWLLDGGKAGLLADVKSPASIAFGMCRLAEDRNLRRELAQSGRRRALDEYRLERVTAPYEAALSKAVQEYVH